MASSATNTVLSYESSTTFIAFKRNAGKKFMSFSRGKVYILFWKRALTDASEEKKSTYKQKKKKHKLEEIERSIYLRTKRLTPPWEPATSKRLRFVSITILVTVGIKHRIDDGNQQTAHNPPYNLCTCMYSMNNPDSIHTIYTTCTAKIPGTMHCEWNIRDLSTSTCHLATHASQAGDKYVSS